MPDIAFNCSSNNRTESEKLSELMELFPLNSYWCYTDNNKYHYFWIYGYTVNRDGFMYANSRSIRYSHCDTPDEKGNKRSVYWQISNTFETKHWQNHIRITKEEYEDVEERFVRGLTNASGIVKFFIPEDYEEHKDEYDKFFNPEDNKSNSIIPPVMINLSDLKEGQKILYMREDSSVIQLYDVLEKIIVDDKINYKTRERQYTYCVENGYVHRIPENTEVKVFCLVSEFDDCVLSYNELDTKYYLLNDQQFNMIDKMLTDAKKQFVKIMSINFLKI